MSGLIPCLALCCRGYNALQSWQSIVGPRNHRVASYTDQFSLSEGITKESSLKYIRSIPYLRYKFGVKVRFTRKYSSYPSVSAVYGPKLLSSIESCLFYSPRSNERSAELLMQFFGGTVTSQQLEQIDSRKLRGQRILSRLFVNQDNPNDELFDVV